MVWVDLWWTGIWLLSLRSLVRKGTFTEDLVLNQLPVQSLSKSSPVKLLLNFSSGIEILATGLMWSSEYKQLPTFITCFISDKSQGHNETSIMLSTVRNWFADSGLAETYKQATHWTAKHELLGDNQISYKPL